VLSCKQLDPERRRHTIILRRRYDDTSQRDARQARCQRITRTTWETDR